MKILSINNFFSDYGGAERTRSKITKLLEKYGHQFFYFSTTKEPYFIEDYEYSKYFPIYKNKRSFSLGKIKNFTDIFYNIEAKTNLENYICDVKPEIALVHNFLYYLTPSIFDTLNKYNIPIVLYIHDPRLFCPGGTLSFNDNYCNEEHCIKGNPIACIKNKCKHNSLKASVVSSLNFLFVQQLKIFDRVDTIICISEALKDLSIRAGLPAEKIQVIKHFLEEDDFNIIPNYQNKNYFLYVGRLDREKGVHFLIEAMKNVSKDVELHIVGNGAEKENLIKQAELLNLDNIKFIGFLRGKELKEKYNNCIATVLPCNWFEAFGLTNIESFIHGKPVIASHIGAIPEIVEHEKNGILFEPGNVKQLSDALNELYYNPEKVVQYGKNGRQKAETVYTPEIYLSKILPLLQALL